MITMVFAAVYTEFTGIEDSVVVEKNALLSQVYHDLARIQQRMLEQITCNGDGTQRSYQSVDAGQIMNGN
jgi:hypothetical protein